MDLSDRVRDQPSGSKWISISDHPAFYATLPIGISIFSHSIFLPFEHPSFLNVGLFRADSAFQAFSSRTFISL
jgi:hypothetical protein